MSWRYNYYTPSTPIKIEGGIKAKSRRGVIGDTWWSKQWVKVLESFGWDNRLQRGRRYARSGQVIDFKLSPGKVKAKVQGSVRTPYSVSIEMKPFQVKEWERITDEMSRKAIFAAKLLAGEMPQNIEDAFNTAGVSLFPKSSKDIKTHCSCPDSANPCKHIAAVYYILAEEFDNDPFMLFKLRGKTREEITISLRKKRTIDLKSQDNLEDISYSKTIEKKEDAIFSLDNFWTGEEIDSFSVNISPPEVSTAIIKRLGTPQFWDSKENFIEIMSELYDKISSCAIKAAYREKFKLGRIEGKKSIKKKRETQKLVKPVNISNLQEIFFRETGKNAIWRGKETKGYLEWKKKYSTKNKD
ncbi:MAG: SWIM zinc finger family protein [Promethearchaeota archaeon]